MHRIAQWRDTNRTDMGQLDEYDTFKDLVKDSPLPVLYKKIRVHLVYGVKHDGHHKARSVDDGHLTDVPVEIVYYIVFPLNCI